MLVACHNLGVIMLARRHKGGVSFYFEYMLSFCFAFLFYCPFSSYNFHNEISAVNLRANTGNIISFQVIHGLLVSLHLSRGVFFRSL